MVTGKGRSEGRVAAPPHVLVFPFPAQGHVNSMLKLAELLSLAGDIHVTFLNTDYNHARLSRFSSATFSRLALLPNFRFLSIPDGLPEDQPRSVNSLWDLEQSLRTRSAAPLRDLFLSLIIRHQPSDDGWPALTCVIIDGIMMYAADMAEELGIPAIAFRTISAACVWAYFCIPDMISGGDLPFPDDDADLDEPIRSAPGMEQFLRRRDLPKPCRDAKHADDYFLRLLSTVTADASRARGLILNTLECLEGPLLSRIRSIQYCPVTYAVGPLHSLLATYGGDASSGNMWEEDRSCVDWLDTQPRRSVVYVSFGSFTVVTREELVEFWHGLVDSGQPFLWVARAGMVSGDEEMAAPTAEVEEATRERGRLVGWVPQAEVLGHPAVGCFLTHSGWNSTLESVAAGVPMICWPFFADQQTNSRVVSEVWRVGMDMKDTCSRNIVAGMVREVIAGGDEGEAVRRSAAEKAEMARRSVEEGGSSYVDLQRLIQHVTSFK